MIVVALAITYSYGRAELSRELTRAALADLGVRAHLVARQASGSGAALDATREWDALADELGRHARARVTIIRSDGVVLGDSEVPVSGLTIVENHARRPEFRAAMAHGEGDSTRVSHTVDQPMMYAAVPFSRDGRRIGVSRVARPLTEIDAAVARLRTALAIAALLGLAGAVVISSVAAELASRRVRSLTSSARAMARGNLQTRVALEGEDEVAELGRTLDQLAQGLANKLHELQGQRDRLSGILSGMQEGVLLIDANNTVALVNPALREMLLLGPDAVGKTPIEVIRHAELKELIDSVRVNPEPASREIEVAGLKPRRVLVRVAPLAGVERGVFAVFFDVTEMRRLESLRRDFVANVSHELRTPVTAIRSAAETVQTTVTRSPADTAMFIDIIARNAERLHGLVEDLLDLSRIESRELRLNMEALDVSALFSHVTSLFSERAHKRGVLLVEAAPGGAPRVLADRRALEHVLTNLVDNAVKYCGSGAEIRLAMSENGELLRIVVEDTGPGIEARHLPRLFERFYRVDAGRSRELGGTGLGLSIVKHLVEAMGGTVGVESNPGAGTRFSVSLRKAPLLTTSETPRPVSDGAVPLQR